jgi:hypothetical protein
MTLAVLNPTARAGGLLAREWALNRRDIGSTVGQRRRRIDRRSTDTGQRQDEQQQAIDRNQEDLTRL